MFILNNIYKNIVLLLVISVFLSCTIKQKQDSAKARIVSLAPNITEVLFALDLGDQVVAVSDYCSYPEQAKEKESIGGLLNPNLEKITALAPDLIIGTESYRDIKDKLGQGSFNIVLLPEKTVNDVYVTIDSVGHLTHTQKRAQKLINSIKDSLALYRANHAETRPNAILVLGRSENGTRNISISSKGAFINELWEYCGGQNAFYDLGNSFAQVNREDLLSRDPELIVEFKSNKNWSLDLDKKNKREWLDLNISAVRNNSIYVINGNEYLTPGPRMFLLAKKYHEILSDFRGSKSGENPDR